MLSVAILLFCLSKVSLALEPQCSRFHYEEQTLMKMIRLENVVQNIKNDIDTIETRVTDLENERERMKPNLGKEREITVKELKEVRKEIQMLEEVFKNAPDQANTPASISESTTKPTVAFVAKQPTNMHLIVSHTIIYGDVTLNEGNGYNKLSGVFTAPVKGTYLFTLQFCLPQTDGTCFAVISKGREIKRGYMDNDSNPGCFTSDAIDVLNKGDRVYIKCTNESRLPRGIDYWNTFSGVLVHS